MNQYEAKFAREAKDCPMDWIILPASLYHSGRYKLVMTKRFVCRCCGAITLSENKPRRCEKCTGRFFEELP